MSPTTTRQRVSIGRLDAWPDGAGWSICALITNVQLRLDIPTTEGSGVNVHVLCSPDEVDELEGFVGALEFTSGGRGQRADTDGLAALGRAFTGESHLDVEAALPVGAMQCNVTFEELRKQFEANSWAKKNCLVAIAGGQGDGSSGLRTAGGAIHGTTAGDRGISAHHLYQQSTADRLLVR